MLNEQQISVQQDSVVAIDPRIVRELRPGEQLLWWGKPDSAYMAQRRAIRAISLYFWFQFFFFLFLLLFEAAFVIFFTFLPISVTQINLLGAIIFFSAMLLFILPLTINARVTRGHMRIQLKELKQTVYAITNQRIVEVFGYEALRVSSYYRADIDKITRVETQDGRGDIAYSTPPLIASPLISLTTRRMVGIPDVRAVQELLLKTFKDEGVLLEP